MIRDCLKFKFFGQMKSLQPALLLIVTLLALFKLPLCAKDKNLFVAHVKSYIDTDEALSKEFKSFTKEFGSPVWSQATEELVGQTKIAMAPVIDYKNDFTNGMLLFIEGKTGEIKYKFISRDKLLKHYISKKKNKSIIYRDNLIGVFLKFDLKLFNIIEQKMTEAMGFQNGNEESEIKSFQVSDTIESLFSD